MKLKHCLSTILFLMPIWVVAQNSPVTITYERSGKGEVTFYADNISYTPYTVALTFTRLSGTLSLQEGDTHKATAFSRRKTRLLTLKPVTENAGIGFSYRFNITKGDWHAKTDTNFVYLFPLTEGKRVRMNHMVSLEKVLGSDDKSRLTGISFQTADGDTIVAARRGIVPEVQDNSASEAEHKSFSAKENFVEICQDDGTFARYILFRDNGIFVSPGDQVIPGQPLGIIGGSNYERGSHLRFSIYCPDMHKFTFVPCFYLSPGKTGKPAVGELYVSEHPQEIIMQEMSKKEKKKYMEKH